METRIRKRLVGNFMLIIIITVLILEIFLLNVVKQYYYNSVEEILSNQVMFSADFYSRYFASNNLEDIVLDDVDVFWHQTTAQVQILDLNGKILMDSIGASKESNSIETKDIQKAIDGEKGVWIGNVDYDTASVMAVSYPLTMGNKTIGVLRFISSLRQTNEIIKTISKILLLAGAIVVGISGVLSVFLSNTIVKPLQEVTEVAEKMADGQLKIRSEKKFDDEIGKLSDTLNYMAEELMKKEQVKNDFISSISHELRTPLTSIKGWAITLQTDEIKENPLLRDGLYIIEKESDRLSNMVDELLEFSKYVSGRITLEKTEVNIKDIVDYIGKQLSPRAKDKNIQFKVHQEANLPIIIADESRIKQVLINLIDNAIKFTPDEGNVSLIVTREEENILIKVKDTGCGISEEDLPHIMEKFYKGKGSKSHTGLGLSICNEIVKLHGGFIKIESKENKGTTIAVYLPIEVGV